MGVGGWIADLFGYKDLYAPGNSLVTRRGALRFLGGTLVDNPVTGTTDYTPPPSGVTTLAAQFTMPASGGNVTVTPVSVAALVAGAPVYVATAGAMSVVSVGTTTAVLQNTGASGNASPGATIAAGSSIVPSGAPGAAGVNNHAAVRVAQTAPLPGNPVYSGGAITGSAALTTQLDGIGPSYSGTGGPLAVGQRVFVRDADVGGSLPQTRSGIYTVASLGGSSYSLVRAADMNSSSDFLGGDAFDVTDGGPGNQFSGSRWALTTLGAITLDTTALAWAQVNKPIQIVDLGKKYGIVPSNADNAAGFRQFELDCRAAPTGTLTEGVLGVGTYFLSFANLGKLGNVRLRGQVGQTFIMPASSHNAGETLMMGWRKPPTVYGGTVDTGSGLTPIYMYDETSPGSGFDPYFDITRSGCVAFRSDPVAYTADTSDWTPFAFAFNFRQMALPAAGATAASVHYYSCRGSVGSGSFGVAQLTTLFSLTVNGSGGVHLDCRLTDVTTGAYGAITQLQATPLVVTANYTQPAVGSTVSTQCLSTSGLSGGQTVYVIGGGYYTVSSVTDSTHVVLTNTGATGNAAPGATIAVTATTANFTQPAADATVTVIMPSTAALQTGKLCSVVGGGIYSVLQVMDSTHAVLRNRGDAGNAAAGTTINSGAVVSAALLSVVGTSVITGDGTIKPTNDYQNVCVRFATGGTIGVAGITYQTSLDGGLSWRELTPVALGTATSITVQDPPTNGLSFKAKLNLAAGTVVKGQIVSFATSGCDNYYALDLPAGTIVAGSNHEIYWGVDASNKLQLCAGVHGGSWVFASSPPTVHGALLEKPWERFVIGAACNVGPTDAALDVNSALFVLGTLIIQKGASGQWVSPSNPVRTHLPNSGGAIVFGLQPATANTAYDADGVTPIAWSSVAPGSGYGIILPSRPQNLGVVIPGNGIDGIIFDNRPEPQSRSCGPLIHSSTQGRFTNWGVKGGYAGVRFSGPFFYNYLGPFTATATRGDWALDCSSYECDMHGTWVLNGCRKGACWHTSSPRSFGTLKIQSEDASRLHLCGDYLLNPDICIDADDENIANSQYPSAYLIGNIIGKCTVRGNVGSGASPMAAVKMIGSPGGTVVLDCVPGGGGIGYAVQLVDPQNAAPTVIGGPRYPTTGAGVIPLCSRPGRGKPYNGALPSATLPNTTPQTLSWRDGGHTMAASTPGGNITINLADGGEPEGTRWPFSIDAQAGATVTFVDVATGNTLVTLAAGAARDFMFVHADKNAGGWLRRSIG